MFVWDRFFYLQFQFQRRWERTSNGGLQTKEFPVELILGTRADLLGTLGILWPYLITRDVAISVGIEGVVVDERHEALLHRRQRQLHLILQQRITQF